METVNLIHALHRGNLDRVLLEGLKARSDFDDLGLEMRRNVVYCWLRREHDRMSARHGEDAAILQVSVDADRCQVAEMDFSSLALMYRQGQGGRPINEDAVRLLGRLYEATSCSLSEYREGMFSTLEVIVKGSIPPDAIAVID